MPDLENTVAVPTVNASVPAPETKIEDASVTPAAKVEAEPAADNLNAAEKEAAGLLKAQQKTYRAAQKERDADTGRFAAKDGKPPAAKEVDASVKDQKPDAEVEPPKAAIDPPLSWSAELKAKFATLAPDVQSYIAQREKEATTQISKVGEAAKAVEPLIKSLEPHQELLRHYSKQGYSPDKAIGELLRWADAMERNPAAAIEKLARSRGVDLSQFAQSQDQQFDADPRVSALERRIQAAEAREAAWARNAEQAEQQRIDEIESQANASIADFAKDKGDDWIAAESEMLALVTSIREANPGMTYKDILQQAWDRAIWANPQMRAKAQAEADRKRVEAQQKDSAAAQAASRLNIRGAPSPNEPGLSLEDRQREIYRRHHAA